MGVCESELADTYPLEKKPAVSFVKLLEAVTFGDRRKGDLSSLASRLARLDSQLSKEEHKMVSDLAGGRPLSAIAAEIVTRSTRDQQLEAAKKATGIVGAAA